MTITPQNLIALLPLLIVGLTVVVVMLHCVATQSFPQRYARLLGLTRRWFRSGLLARRALWTLRR